MRELVLGLSSQDKWLGYVAEPHRLIDHDFRQQVLQQAKKIMQVVVKNLYVLVDVLHARNYRFAYPDSVLTKPDSNISQVLHSLSLEGVYVPIVYQAWLEAIGGVNLMGTDPAWPFSAYAFNDLDPSLEIYYIDPLFVEADTDFILDQYKQWRASVNQSGEKVIGPFRLVIAPDEYHKANISGADPYELLTLEASVDSILLNERHSFSFLAYIRHAFSWAGFPGFDKYDSPPLDFITSISKKMLEI